MLYKILFLHNDYTLYYNDVFVRYTPVKNYEKDQNNKYSNTIWKHLNFPREKLYYSSKQLLELDFLRKSILQQKMAKIILTFNLEFFWIELINFHIHFSKVIFAKMFLVNLCFMSTFTFWDVLTRFFFLSNVR